MRYLRTGPMALLAATLFAASPTAPARTTALQSAPTPFARCHGSGRITCVVDGDTFWYEGAKIRIADINAPELSHPACAAEAQLAEAATRRIAELLGAGPFELTPWPRPVDRYGRLLMVVQRDGRSIGQTLVAEGLAERWKGYRGNWCQDSPAPPRI